MIKAVPHLGNIDEVPENEWVLEKTGKVNKGAFGEAIVDFYLSNPIARASQLMAELSAAQAERARGPMAAE
jgi:NADH-quinone oxidoreductase subunit G